MTVKNPNANRKEVSSTSSHKLKSNNATDVKKRSASTLKNVPVLKNISPATATNYTTANTNANVSANTKHTKSERKKNVYETKKTVSVGTQTNRKRSYGKEIKGFLPLAESDMIKLDIDYLIKICKTDFWDSEENSPSLVKTNSPLLN